MAHTKIGQKRPIFKITVVIFLTGRKHAAHSSWTTRWHHAFHATHHFFHAAPRHFLHHFLHLGKLLEQHPERVIQKAVKGMLPRNPLGRATFRKLHVYAGADHPHAAQQPTQLEL